MWRQTTRSKLISKKKKKKLIALSIHFQKLDPRAKKYVCQVLRIRVMMLMFDELPNKGIAEIVS